MKLIVAIVLSFVTAEACFAANPYLGTWKFNEAKSIMREGMSKDFIVTYSAQGDKIKMMSVGTFPDGKPKHTIWVGRLDGKAYPVKRSPSRDAAAIRVINDHTTFIQSFKDGRVTWWGTITISRNGKTRTSRLQWIDASGKKISARRVYDKVCEKARN